MEQTATQTRPQAQPQDLRERSAEFHAAQEPMRAALAQRLMADPGTPRFKFAQQARAGLPSGILQHDAQGRLIVNTISDSVRICAGLDGIELIVRTAIYLGFKDFQDQESVDLQYAISAYLKAVHEVGGV